MVLNEGRQDERKACRALVKECVVALDEASHT
jgi:hypothetical protein